MKSCYQYFTQKQAIALTLHEKQAIAIKQQCLLSGWNMSKVANKCDFKPQLLNNEFLNWVEIPMQENEFNGVYCYYYYVFRIQSFILKAIIKFLKIKSHHK